MIAKKIKRLYHSLRKSPAFFAGQSEEFLRRFTVSEWTEYELWLYRHRLFTLKSLKDMHRDSLRFKSRSKISVLMPVYNPDPSEFKQAVDSVLWQAYPEWELCIVDDCSQNRDYLKALGRFPDRRIRVFFKDKNTGIADTSRYALSRSSGEYVALLDQDDELSPDALFLFADALNRADIDFFYSDRDTISPGNKRYMHFFKPDWSPEYLLSFNYITHLDIYSRKLVVDVGGFREGFEGSQDYDLALRASEKASKIYHCPTVLYSWRQSLTSVALSHEAKSYAYASGVRAVRDAIKRRGLAVKDVFENRQLWRGHYRITWDKERLPERKIHLFLISDRPDESKRLRTLFNEYIGQYGMDVQMCGKKPEDITRAVGRLKGEGYIFMADDSLLEIAEEGFLDLLGYLSIDGVGAVGCRFLDVEGKIFSAGLNVTEGGRILYAYRGREEEENGYGAVVKVPRNVTLALPSFWGCRADMLKAKGLDATGGYFYSVMDYLTGLVEGGLRVVYMPYMCFRVDKGRVDSEDFEPLFARRWKGSGMKDGYYNPNLTDINEDYGIKL